MWNQKRHLFIVTCNELDKISEGCFRSSILLEKLEGYSGYIDYLKDQMKTISSIKNQFLTTIMDNDISSLSNKNF